ncbi:hypothetical protein ACS0TY_007857 [Phlomoides rotata]
MLVMMVCATAPNGPDPVPPALQKLESMTLIKHTDAHLDTLDLSNNRINGDKPSSLGDLEHLLKLCVFLVGSHDILLGLDILMQFIVKLKKSKHREMTLKLEKQTEAMGLEAQLKSTSEINKLGVGAKSNNRPVHM